MGCSGSKDNTAAPPPPKPRPAPPAPKSAVSNNPKGTGQNDPKNTKKGAESKYIKADSSYNGSVNGDLHKDATDKGYNRRLRNNLINATAGTDIEALEQAKAKFERNRLEDCGDLTRANERLQYLKLKRDLRDAIRRSHVGVLEKTIAEAKNSPHAGQLSSQIEAAEIKLAHLRELNRYSHDILAMDQSTISELHSYHRPPACVHDIMAASYMLLGHDESTLRDWTYVQAMAGIVGRDSLMHKVRDFDSNNVDETTSKRVREILNYHELDEIRAASNGAAAFHVWATNIVDKIDKDKAEQDSRANDNTNRSSPASKASTKRKNK